MVIIDRLGIKTQIENDVEIDSLYICFRQEKAGIPRLGHQLPPPFDKQLFGLLSDLETAAETTVVVDSECTDKVNRGWSAESYSQTFCNVHCGLAAVTLTEGNLHTCKG